MKNNSSLGRTKFKFQKIKYLLYSLYTFSGVTSERCSSPWLCSRAHPSKFAAAASCWQRVGDFKQLGRDLNPTHPAPEADYLSLVPSSRFFLFFFFFLIFWNSSKWRAN